MARAAKSARILHIIQTFPEHSAGSTSAQTSLILPFFPQRLSPDKQKRTNLFHVLH